MTKKAFKAGDRVVGKIIANRDRAGTVVSTAAGPLRKLIEVRWDGGIVESVTSRAINQAQVTVANNADPIPQPVAAMDSDNDERSNPSMALEDSSDDSSNDDDVSDLL